MHLKSIKYTETVGSRGAWHLENLELGNINLIVGKNATGKTRTLNVVNGLAKLVSGHEKFTYLDGDYNVLFMNKKDKYEYKLEYHDRKIVKEELKINGETFLQRGAEGKGKIMAMKVQKGRSMIDFQAPQNELTVASRRDSIQHPYFEPINQWGKSLLHFAFGSEMGKNHLAVIVEDKKKEDDLLIRDTNQVIGVFRRGVKKFGDKFVKSIIKDMDNIGYSIEGLELKYPDFIQQKIIANPPDGEVVALYVKEKGLKGWITQIDMSQGMYRVLSVVIQLNYAEMTNKTECLLVDDIGEGLDFERSCSLIKLMIEKAQKSSMNLVMATNDRFIMNSVPLEYWSVLSRSGGKCKVYNHSNSKKIFEDFKFTGLNNFDFLATNFVEESKG